MQTTSLSFLFAISVGTVSWASTQVYANYCVPPGFQGWITSFITSNSPHCQGLLTLISNSNNLYGAMVAAVFIGVFSAMRNGIMKIMQYNEYNKD